MLLLSWSGLTLTSLKTNTDTFINSADPDETSRLLRIHIVCNFVIVFTQTLIYNNRCVQIQGRKNPFQKLRNEKVKNRIRIAPIVLQFQKSW